MTSDTESNLFWLILGAAFAAAVIFMSTTGCKLDRNCHRVEIIDTPVAIIQGDAMIVVPPQHGREP